MTGARDQRAEPREPSADDEVEPPEEHFREGGGRYEGRSEDPSAALPEQRRGTQYARQAGRGASYSSHSDTMSEDMDILFSAYSGSRNVEGRGRMFGVTGSSGEAYHSMQVVCAFLRYKLDPELQRRMPGLDIHFRPDDGTTSFDIHSQYRRRRPDEEEIEADFCYVW